MLNDPSRKPNSYHDVEFACYMYSSLLQLVPPLTTILAIYERQRQEKKQPASGISALDVLVYDLSGIALSFAYADGKVADEEPELLRDLKIIVWDSMLTRFDEINQMVFKTVKEKENWHIDLQSLQVIAHHDQLYGTKFGGLIRALYFRFATAMVKVDRHVATEEEQRLADFKAILYPSGNQEKSSMLPGTETVASAKPQQETSHNLPETKDLLSELQRLIGLEGVKQDITRLTNFLQIQKARQAYNLTDAPISRHLVFYGNPGTGKTTMARLLARIYQSLGILTGGQFIEVDRSNLVAEYVGQTASKVKQIVSQAVGGVLFIDEAYTLSHSPSMGDYGHEAVATLLKLMEDNRDNLVVIVAGYPAKMQEFLRSNPGLNSRFTKFFHFEDFAPHELVKIFQVFCLDAEYRLSEKATVKLLAICQSAYATRDETFGNARFVRNLFERTIESQASRLVQASNFTREMLFTIEEDDLPRSDNSYLQDNRERAPTYYPAVVDSTVARASR
jgi:AAA+ superfamily predicted ATPase